MNLTENESRRVVVSGVPDVLPCSRVKDKLIIHFQSSKSHGGDVENVEYPTNLNGVAFVTFDLVHDARKVVAKEQQILKDKDFPQEYLLTVYPLTPDVFFYATAEMDLSIFHHQGTDCLSLLLQSLRSLHRSVRVTGAPSGAASVTVEGPFDAIRALREDLMARAGALATREPLPKEGVTTELSSERKGNSPRGKGPGDPKSRGGASVEGGGVSDRPGPSNNGVEPSSLSVSEHFGRSGTEHRRGAPCSLDSSGTDAAVRERDGDPASPAPSPSSLGPSAGPSMAAVQKAGLTEGADLGRATDCLSSAPGASEAAVADHVGTQPPSPSPPREGATLNPLPYRGSAAPKGPSIWVNTNALSYIRRCQRVVLDACLDAHSVSAQYESRIDLTQVTLSDVGGNTKDPQAVQNALSDLEYLVKHWLSQLRIYFIDCGKDVPEERKRMSGICENVNTRFPEVLCLETESSVKIIGSSASSQLFYESVIDQMNRL